MKKISLLICSLFFAFIINAQTTAPVIEEKQTPKVDIATVLQINETDHDFGKIPYGKPVEFDITIKNISKDSVKVDNVKVGCGCTTPTWEKDKTIAPGEKTNITVGYNAAAEGPFTKFITVTYNDAQTKQKAGSAAERFLKTFGKSERLLACECERSSETSLKQVFTLIGDEGLEEMLSAQDNRLRRMLMSGASDEQLITQLYWHALTRPPAAAELAAGQSLLSSAPDKLVPLQDLAWAAVTQHPLSGVRLEAKP